MSQFLQFLQHQTHRELIEHYSNRKVLVVGADGFLGVNCLRALQALGAELTILTRNAKSRYAEYRGQVFTGDLTDADTVRELVRDQSIVFNLAGGRSASESNRHPEQSLNQELRANLILFHACAELGCSPLVVNCSSRLVYGKPEYQPVDERHPLNPQSIYAVHKLTAEQYLNVFALTHGLQFISFRLSNPYGPYQSDTYKGYGVINKFLQDAAQGKPITLFGNGMQRRDYIFVEDVIEVFLKAAMTPACFGNVFNLGGQNSISIAETANLISELAGGIPVERIDWPEQSKIIETGDYTTDLTKLKNLISLNRECTFREGFEYSLDYYRIYYSAL